MNPNKAKELEEKIESFKDYVESSIESNIENDQESIENGEYDYLIENHCYQEDFPLSEDLEEALEKSSLSKSSMIEKVIDEGNFKMEYEELSSPFQYGGAKENEFYSLPWGGDGECQIDRDSVLALLPSFDLKQEFENFALFEEYVNFNIGRVDNLKKYWDLATTNISHVNVIYNTDYDIVRCLIKDEDSLISFLKENPKPEEKFVNKTLKVTKSEYLSLRNAYDGFCVKCGKINEGGHEPDAEKYACGHCETNNSYGIEILFMGGDVVIVDNEEESNLEDSY